MMKYKIFQITGFIFEMLALLVIFTLSIMFCCASIDNIKMQNQIKDFIEQATFEFEANNVRYYYIECDDLDEEVLTINYNSNGVASRPTLGAPGDLFVMPESRMDYIPFSMEFITYLFGGHAGVVIENNKIIEAMGGASDQMYVFENPTDLFYEERTVVGLRVVGSTKEERMRACENARSIIGKPYNMLFVLNTKDRYYCTDICNRIYSKEFGLDYKIDKNGFHVSCQDLMKSKDTMITYVKIVDGKTTHIYYLKNTKK